MTHWDMLNGKATKFVLVHHLLSSLTILIHVIVHLQRHIIISLEYDHYHGEETASETRTKAKADKTLHD